MRPHPYLRAYMAGVVVPSIFLFGVIVIFAYNRYFFAAPSPFVVGPPGRPLERALIFPMAVVPNAWGLWNMLRLATGSRLSVGAHGAFLPLVLMPGGVFLVSALDMFTIQWDYLLPAVPIAMAVYYLAWKYLVGFLNAEVGVP
jgi:hypothetical protein